jgi:hypothetical protein
MLSMPSRDKEELFTDSVSEIFMRQIEFIMFFISLSFFLLPKIIFFLKLYNKLHF